MSIKKQKFGKFIKEFAAFLICVSVILVLTAPITDVYAQQVPPGGGGQQVPDKPTTPTGDGDGITPFLVPVPGAEKYEGLPSLTVTQPETMLNTFVQGLFKNLKYILGAFAVLFIMVAAVKLIIAGDNEEVVTKQKAAITFGIIGLIIIGFADEMTKVVSVACLPGQVECVEGGFLSSPQALVQQSSVFNREVKIFITFIKYLIGGVAVLMLVRNGIRLVALAGSEESVALDKKNLAFTSIGLVLIIIASTFIDKVLYIVDVSRYPTTGGVEPAISPTQGAQEVVGFTNMVVTFTAPIAILVLIVGAVMYATAGGNEEQMNKAKRMIVLAVIGMVVIYGAFAIISTIIAGQFNP